jgi:hypothetical protein
MADFRDCVDEFGALLFPDELGAIDSKELAEAVKQMYGMIWFLSGGMADRVDLAERQYRMGFLMSPAKGGCSGS